MNILRPIFTTAVILLAAVLFGCSRKEAAKTAPPVPVLVAQAASKNIPAQLRAVGNVLPIAKVTVRSQITGKLDAVHFQEGQPVRKDDLLFSIDPRPAQAALARDRALLENAQIQFARNQKLFDQKLIPQEEYDTSRAARDTLAATVQADELNLGYCEIRAPMDGVAGAQLAFPGNIVKSPDDALLLINQIHPIYVAFAVPERTLPQIKTEMAVHALKVSAGFAGLVGAAPQGEVTFVDNTVDATTGTIQLRATFANDDAKLWPGQFVEVTLTLSEIANAVVVPTQAVQTGQNGQYVFVVKADQTVELRPVQTGDTTAGETVVTSGLRAGETVVTDGHLRLVPGAKVNVKSALAGNGAPNKP